MEDDSRRFPSFRSVLTYLLPFVLFFGFWVFLMKRMSRWRDEGSRQRDVDTA